MGNRGIILAAAMLMAAVFAAWPGIAAATAATEDSPEPSVATVNGDPVSVRMFQRRLARNRSLAYLHFREKHHASPGPDFWTTAHGGLTPGDWLKQRTLQDCVRTKVELGLAKEKGIVAATDYHAFLQALDKENERRRQALAAGEPIYGPQQYGEDQFFLYIMNNIRIALQRRLPEEELRASEEALRQYYESVKTVRYDRGNRVITWAIEIPFGRRHGYPETLTRDQAKAKMDEVKQRLESGERFEDLASEYNEGGVLNEETFDFESRLTDKSHRGGRRAEAMKLSEGETSEMFEDMSAFFILKCIQREPLGIQAFEEVQRDVRIAYVEQEYAALINRLVKSANVEVSQAVLDSIPVR
ncbi:MAG: peptidyl-prolyl cis-trans isomerase [Armatimonadota bacterium]|nr:MAG: peptidyl-prolyl cis-trans isomerase [Armatimonadota bacterium]